MSVFYRDIDVNISDYKSELSKPLIVYERDRGLEIYFNLIRYAYRFDKNPSNLLENLVGAYATVTLVNPSGYEIGINEVEITEDVKVKFVITEDLTDELTEIGTYQLQIHINNDVEGRDTSVFSIPPFNFEVVERLKGIKNELLDSEGNGLTDSEGYQLVSASTNKTINFPADKINEYLSSIPTIQGEINDINTQLDNVMAFKKGQLNNNAEGSVYLDSDIILTSFSNNNNLNLKSNNNIISSNNTPIIFKGPYIYFENMIFENTECVNITGVVKVVFKNCTIRNNYRWGIIIANTDNLIIDNCTFENNGLKPNLQETNEGMAINCDKVKNVEIINSKFISNRGQTAVRLKDVDFIKINDNYFNNNYFRAIEFSTSKGMPSATIYWDTKGSIYNNTILNCGATNPRLNELQSDERTNGIFGDSLYYSVDIYDNKIINCLENAIEGRFGRIENNLIDGTGKGNYPTTATQGVSASAKIIRNNVIKNTRSSGLSSGGTCEWCEDAIIDNNIFENCGDCGIKLHFTELPNLKKITITNNTTYDDKPLLVLLDTKHSIDLIDSTIEKWIISNNTGAIKTVPSRKIIINSNKKELISNGKFYKWTSSLPDNFSIQGHTAVTKEIVGNEVILKIVKNGSATCQLAQEIETDKFESDLFNFSVKYRGTGCRLLLQKINLDNSITNLYDLTDTNDTDGFKEFKVVFNSWKSPDSNKIVLKLICTGDVMDLKDLSLINLI